MAEIWDAYDRQFHKIENVALIRGEPVPEGMYHLACEVIVQHTDGTFLLMQRDPSKHLGSMWELTAGGSALAGETPMECAARELREETGVTASDWRELGRLAHDGHRTLYAVYLCTTDMDKDAVLLQEGETVDYQWVPADRLRKMGADTLASRRTLDLLPDTEI
ncbi:MAG: NUDIX domain-containing protein [Clostridia bacterium]|nr:NUDIX domain-containing protein [Clostridia bacterium]